MNLFELRQIIESKIPWWIPFIPIVILIVSVIYNSLTKKKDTK